MERDESYQNQFIDIWGYLPRIRKAIEQGYNIMFRGPTGTGKTYLLKELAKEYKKPLLILNMTCGASVEEVKGRYVVQPNESGDTTVKWIDGALVTAMKKGYWIVIEETNFMPEELASVFYSVMDDRRNIVLDEHENEVITAHPEYRLFMTANWGYKGTVIPNDAIRNRIDVYFDLGYLNEKEEGKLITRETELKEPIAQLISKFAWRQRQIKSRHQPDISTRILLRWAKLIKHGMHPLEAGEHTIVSLLFHDEKEKDKIREAMKFEFEAYDDLSTTKSRTTKKAKTTTKSGDIEVGDLVSLEKSGLKFYGLVTKITSTRKGDKIWAFWNDKIDEAIKGTPSSWIPIESGDYVSKISLEKKASEL